MHPTKIKIEKLEHHLNLCIAKRDRIEKQIVRAQKLKTVVEDNIAELRGELVELVELRFD